MRILIMCGGRGRRLGELTERVPKPLVEVAGKTILQRKIEHYIAQGFRDFVLCVGYKADLIQETVNSFDYDGNFYFSDSGENAGILKRIYQARDLLDDQVLVTYGDTFADLDLHDLISYHQGNLSSLATMVVAPIQNPFGLVELGHKNNVVSFREKPVLNYYIGYSVIEKRSLEILPSSVIEMPDGKGLVTYFRLLVAMESLSAYFYEGRQITFNTIDELRQAEEDILNFYTASEGK